MRNLRTVVLAGSSLLIVAACASTPMGPMIPVMPGPNKSQAAFAADDDACQQYAADRVQGRVKEAQNREVATGAVGTAVGAGIGAAAGNTKGAIIGGIAGALLGSQAGAGYHQQGIQRQYDMAYAGCMTSRGNEVAGGPPRMRRRDYGPPPPPPPGSSGPGYDQPPPPPDDDQGPPPPPPGN